MILVKEHDKLLVRKLEQLLDIKPNYGEGFEWLVGGDLVFLIFIYLLVSYYCLLIVGSVLDDLL
jgi:hypothetical protein